MSKPNQAALLIIDMQQCMADPAIGPRNNPQAEANIERLLAAWRALDAPIVHIRHMSRSPESVFWPGKPGAAFQSRFMPLDHEHIVEKHVTDAFAQSGLERWLRVRSINSLVIVGVASNYSVEATARAAGCLDFITTVVSDACYTFDRPDLSGKVRSAEDIHQMALSNLNGEYARIVDTAAVLTNLAAAR
ncbi:cysteine hydrolase family protein [Chitinimonas sp.]|uniref:cysteine hydrolase family protein n=1 Tax=Chitinimonas sp. TaxID=1934313 RepID=UPI0035B0C77D